MGAGLDVREVVVLLPKVVGMASILGSSYIVYSLIGNEKSRKKKMKLTFHRFLLVLSLFDIVSSFAIFMTTWAVPRDPPEGMDEVVDESILNYPEHFPWACGTTASCKAQGFFLQLGCTGSGLFTGFLSLQFVVTVRYRWTEARMRNLETFCYATGLVFAVGQGIYSLATDHINVTGAGWCTVNQYPIVCASKYYEQDPTIEPWCNSYPNVVTEDSIKLSKFIFVAAPVALVFGLVVISMALLYHTVRTQEQRTARWSVASQEGRQQKRVVRKAMLFIGNYLIMYVPVAILFILGGAEGNVGDLLANTLLPLQGVLNALVYSNTAERILCCNWCSGCCDNNNDDASKPISSTHRSSLGAAAIDPTNLGQDDQINNPGPVEEGREVTS